MVRNVSGHAVALLQAQRLHAGLALPDSFSQLPPCHDLACCFRHGDDGLFVLLDALCGEEQVLGEVERRALEEGRARKHGRVWVH